MKTNTRTNKKSLRMILGTAAAALMAAAVIGIFSAAPVQVSDAADLQLTSVSDGSFRNGGSSLSTVSIRDNGDGTTYCVVNGGKTFGKNGRCAFNAKISDRTDTDSSNGKTGLVCQDSDGKNVVLVSDCF